MNVAGNSDLIETNVVPLFSSVEVQLPDPMEELITEAELEWENESRPVSQAKRITVSPQQFPDQSIYVLEQQLTNLRESMARLKFYLTDLDDLLPR